MSESDRYSQAERTTSFVVYVTTVLGGALVAAPDRAGDLLGARDDFGLRLIGAVDVVIAAGLLFSARWSRWLLARGESPTASSPTRR